MDRLRQWSLLTSIFVAVILPTGQALGEEPEAEPPPLPLHTVEGTGGIFSTMTAYLANPAPEGEVIGRPSVGYSHVFLGNGRALNALTLTETVGSRVELGYGYENLSLGDLPRDIERAFAGAVQVGDQSVGLHNLSARVNAVQEGDFGLPWVPALTFGIHYKLNDTIKDIDRDLGGALEAIGIEDDDGWDFSLVASKMVTDLLPRPLILSAGVRSTQAAHTGLLGFTDERDLVFEASAVAFVSDSVLVGAEYRQKPSGYEPIPGLVEEEDDWWTVVACWLVSDRLTLAAGYGHFGRVLNHRANRTLGIALKYEF